MRGRERICVALDVPTAEQAIALVEQLHDVVGWFKVGKELFTATGPAIFEQLIAAGAKKIFCDLKDKDIPATVGGVAASHTSNRVQMFNVMADGGSEMMVAAVAGANERANRLGVGRPKIIAVTVLTSINGEKLVEELRVGMPLPEYVVHLATLAKGAGLDGVVASPNEAAMIREACGPNFLIVTPGIRPAGSDANDQQRLATPAAAIRNGSDVLVIGRPITKSDCPRAAAEAIGVEIIETEALIALERCQALIMNDHIVYTSGKHGRAYVNKDAIYPHTGVVSELCLGIAEHFQFDEVDVVVAPAVGGVVLEQWTAHHLSQLCGREILGVYAEKDGDNFVLKRGYDQLVVGKRCLVVEDVMTTGGSAAKVIELVRATGGEVIGLGVICNRGGIRPEDVGNPPELYALTDISLESWGEADCPLCQQGVSVNTDVGKGAEFLAKRGLKKCSDCRTVHKIDEACPA